MSRSRKHSSRRRKKNKVNFKAIIGSIAMVLISISAILFFLKTGDDNETQPTETSVNILPLSQIIEKYYENAGGLKHLEAMRSMQISLEIESDSETKKMNILKKSPHFLRIQLEDQNGRTIQAFDGERAWGQFPGMSENTFVWLKPQVADSLKMQATLLPNLVNYRKNGHKARLKGLSEVDGKKVYEIELKLKEGKQEIYYLDTQTFREVKVSIIENDLKSEQYFSDYELHDGFWVAMKSEQRDGDKVTSTLTTTSARFNIGLLKKAFQNPSHNYKKTETK